MAITQRDFEILETAVTEILDATAIDVPGANYLAFDPAKLYRSLKFQNLSRARFISEMNDVLCSSGTVSRFGMWVIAELESTMFVLVRIPDGTHGAAVPMAQLKMSRSGAVKISATSSPEFLEERFGVDEDDFSVEDTEID